MARYSISDTTLTALGDAVRTTVGIDKKIIKTETNFQLDNTTVKYDLSDMYGRRFKITLNNIVFAEGCNEIQMNVKIITDYGTYSDTSYLIRPGDTEIVKYCYFQPNYQYLTFLSLGSTGSSLDIKMEAIDENKNFYTQTPQEMIETLNNLPPIPTESNLTFKGDCSYLCRGGGWDWFINKYGNVITTKDITNAREMFAYVDIQKIPFELNFKPSTTITASSMFSSAEYLTEIPKFNGFQPAYLDYMFQYCYYLLEFPEDYATDWNWSYLNSLTSGYSGNASQMFVGCYTLRKLPMAVFAGGNPYANYSYCIFYHLAEHCQFLDEIIDLPNPHYKATYNQSGYSNIFNSTVNNCFRLKNFTFAKMEPPQWAQQTLDFSTSTGWASKTPGGIYKAYNHGEFKPGHITADKEVTNDATYQALKNDPDWFSKKVEYSRYNHDSAVTTINSLPDCSVYQASSGKSANIIKFKGAAGELTDGGAINTLTEEEIAVAVAKGWTVSLV